MKMSPLRNARLLMLSAVLASLLGAGAPAEQRTGTLDIYWIDVEGGAATLIVTPTGQSLLMDAGWAGFNDRDASRIENVIKKEAGLTRLDYFLISHFHADHAGGLAALASRVDIGAFVDHGDAVENTADVRALFGQYLTLAGSRRRTAKPGERLVLNGVELVIVAAHSQFLTTPLAGAAANPLCAQFQQHPEDATENGKSLGFHMRVGQFDFLNLGDLSWNFQQQLACPVSLLGKVDLFQLPHHGTRDDVLPQLMWAITPSVAVMSNGPTKGAGPVAVEAALRSPGLEDLWALHRAVNNDSAHNATEPLTANLGATNGCAGAWIRARLAPDGLSYTVTNSRNGYTKTYRVR